MVIIDDHGAGWPGSCVDEQNGSGNKMSMVDMSAAFESVASQTKIGKFEIVAFHACLMSMVEVAYQLRTSAKYLVASEFVLPMESVFGSSEWLGYLTLNPSTGGADLARKIVTAVYNSAVDKQKQAHMAATDLSEMDHLAAKVDNLGTQLRTTATQFWWEVYQAWGSCWNTELDYPAYVDIRDFANNLKLQDSLKTINLVKNAADSVIAAVNDAVIMTKTNVMSVTRGGLTIHMPYLMNLYDSTNYARLDFRDVPWTNFLSYYIHGLEEILAHRVSISGTISWTGHSLTYPIAFLDTSHTSAIHGIFATSADGSGAFTIQYNGQSSLEAYIEAFDDLNNNFAIDSNEPIGGYDANNDGYWDLITIQPGETITGANISLSVPSGQSMKRPPSIIAK